MTFEVEVPLRQHMIWPAFTDPEKTARAVPGLIVDAVHPVPPAEGSDGVAGDVVAGRLKLRVGAGGSAAAITYRGTGCIAAANAAKGTLDIAVDAAQARGSGALAGYLRITLAPAGEAGARTLVSVVPELELSGRALEFAREDWHAAVTALAAGWVEALTADLVEDDAQDAEAAPEAEAVGEAEVAPEAETVPEARPAAEAEAEPEAAAETEPEAEAEPEAAAAAEPQTEPAVRPEVADRQSSADPDAISEDPLEPIWQGRYEKNRWLPVLAALTLFLLIKRRRRHRTDPPGADSSFRME
jgi:carbon monoxide dehydrogenase subunit G